jgi:hypothetical protein
MGRTKGRANGDGDVFPRKNKGGQITSYCRPSAIWRKHWASSPRSY